MQADEAYLLNGCLQLPHQFSWGDGFDCLGHYRVSYLNATMERLPFVTSLWFGEGYDYNRSPDYWLVEISELPFGVSGEMLNYRDGGNPRRRMLYGMSGRLNVTVPAIRAFQDDAVFPVEAGEGWLLILEESK